MNRRGFLGLLGLAPIASVVAYAAKTVNPVKAVPVEPVIPIDPRYINWTNEINPVNVYRERAYLDLAHYRMVNGQTPNVTQYEIERLAQEVDREFVRENIFQPYTKG